MIVGRLAVTAAIVGLGLRLLFGTPGAKVHMIAGPWDPMIIGPISDFVFGSKMNHFGYPKCAQMPPNGNQERGFHYDLSKIRFWVVPCPILEPVNPCK